MKKKRNMKKYRIKKYNINEYIFKFSKDGEPYINKFSKEYQIFKGKMKNSSFFINIFRLKFCLKE